MLLRSGIVTLLIVVLSVSGCCILPVSAEKNDPKVVPYDTYVPYQIDEPITFPDIVITYKGMELEEGHEKISSSVFEVTSGSTTKRVIAPPLSMSGTLVRFGIRFYRLFHRPGPKTVSVRRGIW